MEKEKIKLSREVADELQALRNNGWTDYQIIAHIYKHWSDGYRGSPMSVFAGRCPSPFLRALADGYEVEQTPEDKVREMFERAVHHEKEPANDCALNWWEGRRMAIIDTLNAIGIKIDGVNA